jgi:hypothetical protein
VAPAPPQTKLQYFAVDGAGALKSHVGVAVVPTGTSVGQVPLLEHAGEQKLPEMPVIWIACSSDPHAPAFGFS